MIEMLVGQEPQEPGAQASIAQSAETQQQADGDSKRSDVGCKALI
jgi:hypothetical protein